jgi:hypothetical protein
VLLSGRQLFTDRGDSTHVRPDVSC